MKFKPRHWIAAVAAVFSFQAWSQTVNLPVPIFGQEQLPWCWAATDKMIRWHFERIEVPQCDIASTLLKAPCCTDMTNCMKFGNTQIPGSGQYNFQTMAGTAIAYSTIKVNINESKPWIYGYQLNSGGGHLMVGAGYSTDGASIKNVLIIDPMPVGVGNCRWITYNEYKGGSGYPGKVWYQHYDLSLK
jgi:Papain-like cysteine protease AvrRpt2